MDQKERMYMLNKIARLFLGAFLIVSMNNSVFAEDDLFGEFPQDQLSEQKNTQAENKIVLSPTLKVAVADIKIGHKTAKLVFQDDVARDSITSAMVDQGSYSVIDWSRLNSVLFRRNLEWSDVVKHENQRKEIKDILLNDYFLVGTISSYSERWEYDSSAFSKSKTQISTVKLDLFIKDSISNEIIASASEQVEKRKEISQSLGFGANGGADASLAIEALQGAAQQAANTLAVKLQPKTGGEKNGK